MIAGQAALLAPGPNAQQPSADIFKRTRSHSPTVQPASLRSTVRIRVVIGEDRSCQRNITHG